MNIFCFGLSHRTATVGIRERFAIPNTALADYLQRLTRISGVDEGVILSTCNRTEFYIASQAPELAAGSLLQDLYPDGRSADLDPLVPLAALQAARHLFSVASGLESMVLGETEIFGQVKRAYETAMRNGTTGKFLNRLFQKSFEVGKQVRATTGITRGSVSVGSVAVGLAEQIFGDLNGSKVMILGAGETSEKTARALRSKGAQQIFVSNRSFERAQRLALAMGGRAIRFDDWANDFRDLDILVSSTSAPHALVTVEKLDPILRGRRDRPLFIIDLAMPRDVDPEVHCLDGVYVYDLDSLQRIADCTLEARKLEAERCESLIEKYVTDFQAWLDRSGKSTGSPMAVQCP